MQEDQPQPPVEARHREAAADLAQQFQRYTYVQIEAPAIRRGEHDDWELVQAFARFEQSLTTVPTGERREAVARTARNVLIADIVDPDAFVDPYNEYLDARREHALRKADAILALPAEPASTGAAEAFQQCVAPWMQACFGAEISSDRVERGDRLLEEVLELLQSGGYDPSRVDPLVEYTWGRPVGEPFQEVGGVMVTLAAYCLAFGLDMHAAGETELARINTPETIAKIRTKQATKAAAIGNSSSLPIAPKPAADLPGGEVPDQPRAEAGDGLPIAVTFALAYLDGALEDEPAEILKQWNKVRAFVQASGERARG